MRQRDESSPTPQHGVFTRDTWWIYLTWYSEKCPDSNCVPMSNLTCNAYEMIFLIRNHKSHSWANRKSPNIDPLPTFW